MVSWEGSLAPVALDIGSDKVVYLVNTVTTGASRNEWRVPNYEYYVVFRLTEQGWQRIALSQLPGSIQPNLLGNTYSLFVDRGVASGIHIDLEMKHDLQSDGSLAERYKRIIRSPVPGNK